MTTTIPLAPTVEAIDEWLARTKPREDGHYYANDDSYMVDVRTKAGSWRCITMRQSGMGYVDGIDGPGWWTIRGEGSSNGCRETWVAARKVVEARGHHHPAWKYGDE